jgi:glycosyl transferase family 25
MKIVVINLARSVERREHISTQLRRLNLDFEFAVAVDGQNLSGHQMGLYSADAAFTNLGRGLHRNEIGCFLSHVQVWETLVESGQNEFLILEDDVTIADDLVSLIRRHEEWIPTDAGVVYFAHHVANEINLVPISVPARSPRFLCEFDGPVMSSSAYLLRRAAAINLLRHWKPIRMATDDLLGRPQFSGRIYGVVPKPVIWTDHGSTIWTDTTREQFTSHSRGGFIGFVRRIKNKVWPQEGLR